MGRRWLIKQRGESTEVVFWGERPFLYDKMTFLKENCLFSTKKLPFLKWDEKSNLEMNEIRKQGENRRKTTKSTENSEFIALNHENDSTIRNKRQKCWELSSNLPKLLEFTESSCSKNDQNHQKKRLKSFQPTKSNSRIKIPG